MIIVFSCGQAKRKIKYDLGIIDTSQLSTVEEFAKHLNEIKAGGGKLNGKVVLEDDIKSLQLLIDTYDKTVEEQKNFKLQLQQLVTGTTANAISDSIIEGFRNGKRAAGDFADTFQDLMSTAVLNSLKFRALEGPLQEFYDQFAKFGASDEILTEQEIKDLKTNFNDIINNASKQFDQLQQVTNLGFTGAGLNSGGNSIHGSIKAQLSEETGSVIAGQFGALPLTAGPITLSLLRVPLVEH